MTVLNEGLKSKVAQVELIYRNKVKASERPVITSSKDAYGLFLATWDMNKIELVESFKVMLLDRRVSCLGISEISTGAVNFCLADAKIIFATALKARASNLILVHNHPSGHTTPSQPDIILTKKLKQAGELLDINVYDHLIITPQEYYSFADNGIMPTP